MIGGPNMAAVIPFMGAPFGCIASQLGRVGFFASFDSDKTRAYAVTCSHNLAPLYSSAVTKPSANLQDQCEVYLPKNMLGDENLIGYRTWASTLRQDVPVDFDCGITRLTVHPSLSIGTQFVNTKWIDTRLPDDLLLIVGSQSIPGTLNGQDSSSQDLAIPGLDGKFSYNNLYSVDYSQPGQTGPPIAEGMSGAPVLSNDGVLVGMHIAGQDATGYFYRADEMLRWMGMDIYQS